MPGMDGPTTPERSPGAHAELAHIPVIFMTAKVQKHEVERYLALGAAGVVCKPFDPHGAPGHESAGSSPASCGRPDERARDRRGAGGALRAAYAKDLPRLLRDLEAQLDMAAARPRRRHPGGTARLTGSAAPPGRTRLPGEVTSAIAGRIEDALDEGLPVTPELRQRPGRARASMRRGSDQTCVKAQEKESGRRDLNPRQRAPKARALPDCATPRRRSRSDAPGGTLAEPRQRRCRDAGNGLRLGRRHTPHSACSSPRRSCSTTRSICTSPSRARTAKVSTPMAAAARATASRSASA